MTALAAIHYELRLARRRLEDYRIPVREAANPAPRDVLVFSRAAIEVELLERLLRAVTDG